MKKRLSLAALLLLPALMGMGGQPWEEGTLVALGMQPLVHLGVERKDGEIYALRPAPEDAGVSQQELDRLKPLAGRKIRYRVLREDSAPLYGRGIQLRNVQLVSAP